jgi:hypothetical protein
MTDKELVYPMKRVEKSESAETVDEIVAQAVKAKDGNERRRIAAKARSLGHELIKKPQGKGRPTKYSQSMADKIIAMVSAGKTLTKISNELGLALQDVYNWLNDYPDFLSSYQHARKLMCVSLIDSMLDQAEKAEREEALLLKVKSGIYQWVAARYNADQFSEKRNVQINGEISHRHSHQLEASQKKRIAESWLMSQTPGDTPGIIAETSGPALSGLESVGVSEYNQEPSRVIPTRKQPYAAANRQKEVPDNW